MASFASVMEFVERVNGLERLDVCVLNAAIVVTEWNATADGWEEALQVNLLSTVLLALHMLAKQVASARAHPGYTPRLTLTVSVAYETTAFSQRDEPNVLQLLNRKEYMEDPANRWERYASTKLFLMYCGREMAKLVPESPAGGAEPAVVVNMVHPGFCHSDLTRNAGIGYPIFAFFLAKSGEKGSRTLVDGAIKSVESHGQYLNCCVVTRYVISSLTKWLLLIVVLVLGARGKLRVRGVKRLRRRCGMRWWVCWRRSIRGSCSR